MVKSRQKIATNSDLFRIHLLKKLLTHTPSPSFTAPLIHQAILAPKGTLWRDWGRGVLAVPAIDKGCVCIPTYQNTYFLNKSFFQGSSFLAISRLPFHTDTAHRSGSDHFITCLDGSYSKHMPRKWFKLQVDLYLLLMTSKQTYRWKS